MFKEGTHVRKGQLLVQLNDADLLAGLQKLKAQKDQLGRNLNRNKELVAIGGISRQDFETTNTSIASIDADIAIQEAALRKMRIIAPFDGTIGLRQVSEGAIVTPATTVATLQQLRPMKIDFTIPDSYYGNVKPGSVVFFTIGQEREKHSGTIVAVEPGADATTRSLSVRALVNAAEGRLLPGSFANVQVISDRQADALLIPSQCIIPTTKDKKVALMREGKATMAVVTLGERTENMVRVLEGLKSGDTILTTGIMQVKQDMEVTITKIKS
jgi:membrane fusion protein (multidrug efflux system)